MSCFEWLAERVSSGARAVIGFPGRALWNPPVCPPVQSVPNSSEHQSAMSTTRVQHHEGAAQFEQPI
jgi:hypothetical protein